MRVGPLHVTGIKVHLSYVGVWLPLTGINLQGFLKLDSSRLGIPLVQLPLSLGNRPLSFCFACFAVVLRGGCPLKILQVGGVASSVAFTAISSRQDIIGRRHTEACCFHGF